MLDFNKIQNEADEVIKSVFGANAYAIAGDKESVIYWLYIGENEEDAKTYTTK